MKVYISCASKKKKFAKRVADMFENDGFTITCKWWDWDVDRIEHTEIMQLLRAIECSDIVVVLSDCMSYGVALEVGYAYALGKPVYSSGHINIDSYSEMFYLVEHIKGYHNLVKMLKE